MHTPLPPFPQRSYDLQITGLQASSRLREIEYNRVAQAVLALAEGQPVTVTSTATATATSSPSAGTDATDVSVNRLVEVCKALEAVKQEAAADKQRLQDLLAKVRDYWHTHGKD